MEYGDNEAHDPPVEDWHGISNPIALAMADHLLRHMPTPALELASLPWENLPASAQRTRQQLEAAGIAEKIAQGPSAFHLIYDFMPPHERPLDWKSRINTPAALAQHVMENLTWYLGLPQAVRNPDWPAFFNTYTLSAPLTILMVVLIAFSILNALDLALSQPYSAQFGSLMYFVIPIGSLITIFCWLREYLRNAEEETIRYAAYYRYMLETFADQEDEPVAPAYAESLPVAESSSSADSSQCKTGTRRTTTPAE